MLLLDLRRLSGARAERDAARVANACRWNRGCCKPRDNPNTTTMTAHAACRACAWVGMLVEHWIRERLSKFVPYAVAIIYSAVAPLVADARPAWPAPPLPPPTGVVINVSTEPE